MEFYLQVTVTCTHSTLSYVDFLSLIWFFSTKWRTELLFFLSLIPLAYCAASLSAEDSAKYARDCGFLTDMVFWWYGKTELVCDLIVIRMNGVEVCLMYCLRRYGEDRVDWVSSEEVILMLIKSNEWFDRLTGGEGRYFLTSRIW